MALIVEGTTSKDITTAKPKAVATKSPTTGKVTTVVKTSAPTPIATPSASTGGVKSTTATPTSAQNKPTSTAKPTAVMPTTQQIQTGVAQNFQEKVKAPQQAGVLGIAKTAQTNIQQKPTVSGVAGGTGNIQGQKIEPGNAGQYSPVSGFAAQSIQQSQQTLDYLATKDARLTAETDANALRTMQANDLSNLEKQQQDQEDTLNRDKLNRNVNVLNTPSQTASDYQGLPYDPSTGVAIAQTGFMTGNPYFDQLMSMKFDYDPAKDPEYINGAKVLENQVAQMMVGRGGLYSSVNQAALSSKLIEFQIALRKERYNQFVQDRSFMLQMANTVWDRQDAAFNQYMTVAKYNADREDAMFSRQMQQEQLNLQRASAALAQARYKAEIEAYNGANQLNNLVSQVKYEQGMYSKMYDEWRKTGVASTNVAAYFGTTPGAKFNYSAQKYTVAKVNYIDSLTSQATLLARDMNELDIMQAGLAGFLEQTVAPTTEYKYTQTVGEEGTTLRTEWSEYK